MEKELKFVQSLTNEMQLTIQFNAVLLIDVQRSCTARDTHHTITQLHLRSSTATPVAVVVIQGTEVHRKQTGRHHYDLYSIAEMIKKYY